MHIYSSTKNQPRLKIGILGARGYSGMELGRSLLQHPYVESLTLGVNETKISLTHWLPESTHREVSAVSIAELLEKAPQLDVVFLATPAEVSMELTPSLLSSGTRVIDLSGAFRLKDPQTFLKWYGFEHKNQDLLKKAQYGLNPFLKIPEPNQCQLIANPGCYASAVQLALIPILKHGLLKTESIVIDAKSGTTGAGKKPSESQLFAEVDGECLPYKVGKHQHFPEICDHILNFANTTINPIFSTSLIPVRRGIIAGIYAQMNSNFTADNVDEAFQEAFVNYPLVRFGRTEGVEGASLMSLKKVVGSARTHIAYTVDGSKLYLYCCIDNLMKGAASQAIENMNYLWGWPVQTGLLHREGLL